MEKTIKLTIEDISDKAEGIGHCEGRAVFVKGALPGETVDVVITEDKGRFLRGEAACYDPKTCGGAPLIRMKYEDQLAWKEKHVRDVLFRIAGLEDPKINPIIGMEDPYHYRNKGEFKVGAELPYCNTNCRECPIQSEKSMEVLERFRANPRKNAQKLIVRTAENGEYMAFTVQKNGFELLLEGNKIIHDSVGSIKTEVDPFSFYQVNHVQCEKLYSLVRSYVRRGDSMLDLYCGAGTIGLFCSDLCRRVIGVESVHEAVVQANRNAIINHIVNTTFIEGRAENVAAEKLKGVNADIIVVDPPRAGCKESLLGTIADIAPKRLVYVSCNPATLARDVRLLLGMECTGGSHFEFAEATPVDIFPHSIHTEVVCCMVLNK